MDKNLIAKAFISINAPREDIWNALVDPEAIKQYMFGTTVVSAWHEGSPIVWKGEWQGTSYKDKGVILQLKPGRTIQYSHFSPLSGLPDQPENYHTVTIELSADGNQTHVSLAQDNNATEEARNAIRAVVVGNQRRPMMNLTTQSDATGHSAVIRWRAAAPIAVLVFLSPVLAELLMGVVHISNLWLLAPEMGLYGFAALIIREVARRWQRGWGTILLLGIACALAEETTPNRGNALASVAPPCLISHTVSGGRHHALHPWLPSGYEGTTL